MQPKNSLMLITDEVSDLSSENKPKRFAQIEELCSFLLLLTAVVWMGHNIFYSCNVIQIVFFHLLC